MKLMKSYKHINPRKFWLPDIFSIGLTLFLFSAAVKPGLSAEFDSITYSGIVALLREYSQYIGAVGLTLLIYTFLKAPKLSPLNLTYPALWLLLFKLIIALRIITTSESGLEQAVSLISIYILYFIFQAKDGDNNSEKRYVSILKGMYYFTTIIILINFYLYLVEYTNTSWKGRFIGVFHHPNFTGVYFAICGSIILCTNNTFKSNNIKTFFNIFSTTLLLLSFILIMASGSRTGLLGFAAAILGYFYIQKHLKTSTILLLAFISLATYIAFDAIVEMLAYYIPGIDRITQAGNTRDGVWASMWGDFMENPIFGVGANVKDTAGSYFRVLAMGGIFAAFPLLMCIFFCALRVARNRGGYSFRNAWLPGLLCVLTTSITEGYLADSLSLGLIYFVLIVFVLSFRRPITPYKSNQIKGQELDIQKQSPPL